MGRRVHWMLMSLPKSFLKRYQLKFDYEYHNYHFTRYNARTAIDEFIIIRTSRNCFRIMYFNFRTNYFEYGSERTAKSCAQRILRIDEKISRAEEKEEEG